MPDVSTHHSRRHHRHRSPGQPPARTARHAVHTTGRAVSLMLGSWLYLAGFTVLMLWATMVMAGLQQGDANDLSSNEYMAFWYLFWNALWWIGVIPSTLMTLKAAKTVKHLHQHSPRYLKLLQPSFFLAAVLVALMKLVPEYHINITMPINVLVASAVTIYLFKKGSIFKNKLSRVG